MHRGQATNLRNNNDRWLGLAFLAFALAVVFVWVPLDVDSGLVERIRRRLVIGDSLAPVCAGFVIGAGGLLAAFRPTPEARRIAFANLAWASALILLFAASLATMRYAGSAVAQIFAENGYRPLRNTVPWKYIGFLLGGAILVSGMAGLASRRVGGREATLGIVAALLIALAYDLPFEDLLLPPNGDV